MYHVRRDRNDENYGRKDKKRDASAVKFDGDIAESSDKNEANQRKSDPISHPVKHRQILKIRKILERSPSLKSAKFHLSRRPDHR